MVDSLKISRKSTVVIFILVVLFFVASAYGVQRTILSLTTEKSLSVDSWFIDFQWLFIVFTLSSFGLFKASADVLSGPLSLRLGKKQLLLVGTSFFVIGNLSMVLVNGNPLLITAGNSLLGIGEGLLYATAMAYLSDLTAKRQALFMALMELSVYSGYSMGGISAGLISAYFSYEIAFMFALLCSIISFLLVLLTIENIKESAAQFQIQKIKDKIGLTSLSTGEKEKEGTQTSWVKNPRLIIVFCLSHFSKIADAVIVLFIPLVISKAPYNLTLQETGVITSVFTFFWAVSMPLAGRISDKTGRKLPVFFGFLLEALGLFFIFLGSSPFILLFVFSMMAGIGTGFYYPILPSITVDMVDEEIKGSVIGYFRAFKDFGYFTGPLLAGLFAQLWFDYGANIQLVLRMPILMAVVFLMMGAIGIIVVKETHPGWSQFQILLDHARTIKTVVNNATDGMIYYLNQGDLVDKDYFVSLSNYAKIAKDLEVQGDRQLEEIVRHGYHSLVSSPDVGDFLKLARRIDRAGGLSIGAFFRLQSIPIENIPPLIQQRLIEASELLKSLIHITVEEIKVLKIKFAVAEDIYYEVRAIETDLDLLYQIMTKYLFEISKKLHFGDWFAIKDVIDKIEQASDVLEDASEIIFNLSLKYG